MEPKFFLFTRTLSLAKAIVHCTLQGVFIPLLSTFWVSKRNDSKWFKGYVLYINFLALLQTSVEVLQAFYAMESAASIQGFFIYRCWRIFKQRLLPIAPFLILCVGGMISGIMVAAYLWEHGSTYQSQITTAVWIFSSFVLDLSMTTTTVVFLYRSHTGLREHENVFNTIWQVTWASATPPLLIMVVPIVDKYIAPTPTHAATFFALGISGKFFVLSLMLNLVGRGYIREKLELAVKQSHSLNVSPEISAPVFIPGDSDLELETRHSVRNAALVQGPDLAEEPFVIGYHNSVASKIFKPARDGDFNSQASVCERSTSSIYPPMSMSTARV
ncbi:hypothetical protein BDV93DRAFT_312979 [Ceratobasidium sp. AG-I]|nr:hypothetical protein BDV93DRAFT_312979 [Ceratobasidium sp. AG-I]